MFQRSGMLIMFDLDVMDFDRLNVDGSGITAAKKAWESEGIGE